MEQQTVCWNSAHVQKLILLPWQVIKLQQWQNSEKAVKEGLGGGTLLGLQRDMLHPRKARNGVSVIPNMREHVSVAYGVADLAAAAVLVGHPV